MDENSNAPIFTNQIETAEGTIGNNYFSYDPVTKINEYKDPNTGIITRWIGEREDGGTILHPSNCTFKPAKQVATPAAVCYRTVDVEFLKTHPDAKLPERAHETGDTSDTGYDVFAVEDVTIPPCIGVVKADFISDKVTIKVGSAIVPIGIKVGYITPGYWFKVEGKSGLGFKQGLQPHFGIIDNPYRGDCGIKIYNLTDKPYTYKKGDKVAQFVFYPLIHADIKWTDTVSETVRGQGGFGHTGK